MASFYRRRRRLRRLIADFAIILILLVLVIIVYRYAGSDDTITGKPQVIDGDTVKIDGFSIRLIGIDAPEHNQTCHKQSVIYPCGTASTRALKKMIGSMSIDCHGWQKDIYQRLLATCYLSKRKPGEQSLNQKMVRAGWAVSYNDYILDENHAHLKNHGLWSGKFQQPSDWRKENRRSDLLQENLINTVWQWIKNIARL